MANLPFVIQPRLKPITERIGSDEAGYIDIERRGYLTAGEKTFVQQIQQQDNGTIKLIALSRKIASEGSISLEKAYDMVITIMSGKNKTKAAEAIEAKYAIEFQETLGELASAKARESLVHAACMLMHRISSEIQFSEIGELHPDLINGLAQLYADEDLKSIERLQQENPEEGLDSESKEGVNVEELEKKQQEKSR